MNETVDEFLARSADVLDDWHGSADSATWAADGSHERHERSADLIVAASIARFATQASAAVRSLAEAWADAVKPLAEYLARLGRALKPAPPPRPHASVTDYRVRRQLLIRDRRAARRASRGA